MAHNFEIKILATGSKGNAYIIQDDDKSILIDPGIPIKELRKRSNFALSGLDFCLLSHEHKDHSKAIKDIMRMGIQTAMSAGTLQTFEPNGSLYQILMPMDVWEHCGWKVLPFETQHDAAEPLGFLILSPSGKKILYATDTYYIEYRFSGVTHYLVECNYSEKLLKENATLNESVKRRIRQSHFELSNVVKFFQSQNLSATEKIYLIHLSDENSDAAVFIEEIEKATGLPVYLS
jgi:phosphoribosyl 1,2-cyclic phosphodiesterase